MSDQPVYVVLRQADVGSVEADSAWSAFIPAEERADALNQADEPSYKSWVEELTLDAEPPEAGGGS